jgi:hypothetical protein
MTDERNDEKQKALAQTQLTDLQDTIAHLRAKNTQLENQLGSFQESKGAMTELALEVQQAVKAAEPYLKKHRPAIKENRPEKAVVPVLLFSDWHIGEVIRKEETEGFGEFNWNIARKRVFYTVDKFLAWVETHRRAFKIEEAVVLGIGDYVSGDIHRELSVTNEFPVPVQAANAGLLLGEAVRRIAPEFEKVRFFGVGADNHGRLTRKPQAKQKSTNSFSFLVHAIARQALSEHTNVSFYESEGAKKIVNVAGKKLLVEHGDSFARSWMGIPYYGFERARGREAARRMGKDRDLEFDYVIVGHFHVPAIVSGNILVNGSLSGTSEFDHLAGRHALPAQVSFFIHPVHGIFDWVAWKTSI